LLQNTDLNICGRTITFVAYKAFDMKEISVQELKDKKDKGEDFQLIDVREDFEYEMSNLNGISIPLGGILIETDKISKHRTENI